MQLTPQYLSIQGRAILHRKDSSGNPLTGMWLGDAGEAVFKLTENKTDYPENYSGQRATGLTLYNSVTSGFDLKAFQLNSETTKTLYRGEEVTQSTTPVVDRAVTGTDTLKVGDYFTLMARNVTAVTIKDSTGSPITLTANVDYELDPITGLGKILDVTTNGPFTAPLLASYTPGASTTSIKLLSAPREEFWLQLVGVNTAIAGNPPGVLDLYRYQFTLPAETAFINSARAELAITGTVLSDPLKPTSGPLGNYGRIFGFGFES